MLWYRFKADLGNRFAERVLTVYDSRPSDPSISSRIKYPIFQGSWTLDICHHRHGTAMAIAWPVTGAIDSWKGSIPDADRPNSLKPVDHSAPWSMRQASGATQIWYGQIPGFVVELAGHVDIENRPHLRRQKICVWDMSWPASVVVKMQIRLCLGVQLYEIPQPRAWWSNWQIQR